MNLDDQMGIDLGPVRGTISQFTAAITGLTNNATHGLSAQTGVQLTGTITGLVGGETVVHRWLEDGTPISGATASTFTPQIGTNVADGASLRYSPTVDGDPINSASYTVRHVAPVAAAGLLDQTYTQNTGTQTVDASGDFTGLGLTYSVSGGGATVDPNTGVVSIPTSAVLSGVTITVTATNTGGAVSSAFSVTVASAPVAYRNVAKQDFGHSLGFDFNVGAGDANSPDRSVLDFMWTLSQHAGVSFLGELSFGQYDAVSTGWTMPPRQPTSQGLAARPRLSFSSVDGGTTFVANNLTDIVFYSPNFIQFGTTPSSPSDVQPSISVVSKTSEMITDYLAIPGASASTIFWLNSTWPKPYDTTGETLNAAYITEMIAIASSGGYYWQWHQDWLADVRALHPGVDIRLMDQAVIIADLLQTTELANLAPTDLFRDNAPHGNPVMYAVSAAIRFGIMQGLAVPRTWLPAPAPTNPGVPAISQAVLDAFPAIIDRINTLLGYSQPTLAFNEFGPVDYNPTLSVINLAQLLRPPANLADANADANGYPVRMGGESSYVFLFDWAGVPDTHLGDYEFTYTGQGTITVGGVATSVVTSAGQINFTVATKGVVSFTITALPSDVDYLRDFVLLRDEVAWKAEHAAGTFWNPAYIEQINMGGQGVDTFRYMNDQHTNDTLDSPRKITDWAEYPSESSVTFAGTGYPISQLAARVADLGECIPWFCVPTYFTDAAVTSMATAIRDNLPSGRKVKVEYNNEHWNNGTFQHARWITQQAAIDWGTAIASATWTQGSPTVTVSSNTGITTTGILVLIAADGSREHYPVGSISGNNITLETNVTQASETGTASAGEFWGDSWQARRSEQIMQIFETVFAGQTDRLIRCLSYRCFTPTAWQTFDPGSYVDPLTRYQEAITATYHGTPLRFSVQPWTDLVNQITTQTFDTAAAYLQNIMLNDATYGLPELDARLATEQAALAGTGVRLTAYEGGAHEFYSAGGQPAELVTFFRQFYDSDYYAPVLTAHYSICKARTEGPYMHFTLNGKDSTSGTWALYSSLGATNGRATRLKALDAANAPWWTYGAAPAVTAPTVANPIADQALQDDGADVVIDLGTVFTNGGGTNTYDFVSTVTGVTISGSNLTIAPATVGVLASTNIVVRATNAAGNVTDTFALEVTAAPAATPVVLNGTQSISFPGTSGANTFQLDYYGILFSALPSASAFLWGLENGATDQVMWVQTSGRLAINIAGATPGDFAQTSSNIPIGTKFDLRFQYSSAGNLEGSNTLAVYINGGLVLTRGGTGVQNLTNSYLFGDTNNLGHPTMSIDGVTVTVNGVLELNLNPGSPTLFNSNLDRDGRPFSHKGAFS